MYERNRWFVAALRFDVRVLRKKQCKTYAQTLDGYLVASAQTVYGVLSINASVRTTKGLKHEKNCISTRHDVCGAHLVLSQSRDI